MGRHIESDLIGLGGGVSTYGYANGSPLVYSDPEGLIAGRIVLGLEMRYLAPRLAARAELRNAKLQATRHGAAKRLAARVATRATARQAAHCPSASSAAAHQAYKDALRAAMSKPAVSNPNLARIIDPLYRANASVGSGSTAAAIRQELALAYPLAEGFTPKRQLIACGRWNDGWTKIRQHALVMLLQPRMSSET